jgi:hypothetical protein
MPVRRGKSRRKMERFFESCFASFSSKFSSHLLAFSTHLPTTCSLRQLVHFRVNSSPFTAASSSMQLSLLALSLHPGYLAVLLPPPSPVYRFFSVSSDDHRQAHLVSTPNFSSPRACGRWAVRAAAMPSQSAGRGCRMSRSCGTFFLASISASSPSDRSLALYLRWGGSWVGNLESLLVQYL